MPILLVVGGTSEIAKSVALAFGNAGWDIQLAARNVDKLEQVADSLEARLGRIVMRIYLDTMQENASDFWDELPIKPDALFIAVGVLGDQQRAEVDPKYAVEIININFTSLLPIMEKAAVAFSERKAGLIMAVSSVAGDRGRSSNYFYGSSKAALSAYLSGLRNRLASDGVQVLTIKPGVVRTPMTAHLEMPDFLCASPEQVATDILKAVKKKKDIVYTRWFWRWLMQAIKLLPECIFKKFTL